MYIRNLEICDYDEFLEQFHALNGYRAKSASSCEDEEDELYPRDLFETNCKRRDMRSLGAFDGTKLIGFILSSVVYEETEVANIPKVVIDAIYVLPEYRRQGVAASLVKEVEKWCKNSDIRYVFTEVFSFSKDALEFFKAIGMPVYKYCYRKCV